jgi:hypothetical protein
MLIEITDPVYHRKVWVAFENSYEEVCKLIPRDGSMDNSEVGKDLFETPSTGAKMVYDDKTGTFFIWFPFDQVTDSIHYALIAHEIFHVVWFTMREVGMPLSDDSDEAYAYYTQFLMQCIIQFINEQTPPTP